MPSNFSTPRLESPKVRQALTWIDTLGTEHCLLDCDCVSCESYRDGTTDWSKAIKKNTYGHREILESKGKRD